MTLGITRKLLGERDQFVTLEGEPFGVVHIRP